MPLPGLTFVSDGAWGTGQGTPLDAPTHDTNIFTLSEAIEALQDAFDAAIFLAPPYVTSAGNIITFHLSNATTVNAAFDLPGFTYRGAWLNSTAYQVGDIVTVSGAGVFLVLVSHTSVASPEEFDPEQTEEVTDGDLLYGLLLPEPDFTRVMRWKGDSFPAEQDLIPYDVFKDATYGTFKVNVAHFSDETFDPWAVDDDDAALYTKIAPPAFPPVETVTVPTDGEYLVTRSDTGKYLVFTDDVVIMFSDDEYDPGTEIHFQRATGCTSLTFDEGTVTILPQRDGFDTAAPFVGAVITAKLVADSTFKLIGPNGDELTA